MSTPIDIIANALCLKGYNRNEAPVAARDVAATLTDNAIVANAVQRLRTHGWTKDDVEEISDRGLTVIVRIVLGSVGKE